MRAVRLCLTERSCTQRANGARSRFCPSSALTLTLLLKLSDATPETQYPEPQLSRLFELASPLLCVEISCPTRSSSFVATPPSFPTPATSNVSVKTLIYVAVKTAECAAGQSPAYAIARRPTLTESAVSPTAVAVYKPQDATTNPSLILAAVKNPSYARLIDVAVEYAKQKGGYVLASFCIASSSRSICSTPTLTTSS